MSIRMRLPSPRMGRTNTQRMDANDALLKARVSKPEEPEPVGVIVTRPHRVERDGRSLIAEADMTIGTLKSMALGSKATHLVVGNTSGQIAVITVSTLYTGQPKIDKAKVGNSTRPIYVASSAGAETIVAFESSDKSMRGGSPKAYVFSKTASLRTEIERRSAVHAAAVTPDGNKVAIGDADKKVAVYSMTLTSKSQLYEYDVTPYVFEFSISLEFSNSGKWLVMGGDMRKACVWNQSSRSTTPRRVFGRGGHINSLAFSPSDGWLAIGSGGDNLITLVDTATWDIVHEVLQPGTVLDVGFSYDELALSCATNKHMLQVINRGSLETTHEIGGTDFAGVIPSGKWTPDGTLIVMGSKKIFAYDYKTRRDVLMPEVSARGRSVKGALALSVHGRTCAFASGGNVVALTVVSHKDPSSTTLNVGETVTGIAFSPDNTKMAAITGSELFIYRNDQNHKWPKAGQVKLLSTGATQLRWSKAAKHVAVYTSSSVVVVRADDLKIVGSKKHEDAFSVDIGKVSSEFSNPPSVFGNMTKIRAAVNPIVASLGGRNVQDFALSPDGQTIAAGGNGVLALIDLKTMESTLEVTTKGWVMGLAWAPDSQTLAIGGHDKTVQVLHIASGVIIAHCGERGYWPTVLSFSADCGAIIDGGNFSSNPRICVYSCDGSKLPLIEPIDAGPMLGVRMPPAIGKRSDFSKARIEVVADVVSRFPLAALNPLSPTNKELHPNGYGASRLSEVLAQRTERPMLEALFEQIPALALLPSRGVSQTINTPTFDLALKLRDVRTLRVLFLAGAKAPVPLRTPIARQLIPRMVEMRMSSAVTAFLEQCELEDSGADITSGCNKDGTPLVEDDVLELHPTWGGAGTSIWLNYHPDLKMAQRLIASRQGKTVDNDDELVKPSPFQRFTAFISAQLSSAQKYIALEDDETYYDVFHRKVTTLIESVANETMRERLRTYVLGWLPPPTDKSAVKSLGRTGVEVNALRVPIPFLSSKSTLEALGQIGHHGTFDNACMRATVICLWNQHFFISHLVKSLLHVLHVTAFLLYCVTITEGKRSQFTFDPQHSNLIGRYSAFVLVIMSSYIMFFEMRQLLGQQLYLGFLRGTVSYLMSMWNIADVLLSVSVFGAVALDMFGGSIGEGHFHVKGMLAAASILLLGRTAQILRGWELTGWLVMVLLQNLQDMIAFIFLVLMTILFFSISFMMLFKHTDELPDDYGGGRHDTILNSMMNTFTMGVFADFEVDTFNDGMINSIMSKALFIIFMLLVGVVSLNALIAFLGDSYAKVQERQVEASLSLKASLIVEYYNAMGPFAVNRELQVAWTHVLRVIKDEEGMRREWGGQVTQIKREVSDMTKELEGSMEKKLAKVSGDINELKKMITVLGRKNGVKYDDDDGDANEGESGSRSLETGGTDVSEEN